MDSKIIFFDVDGTILSNKTHHISDSTKAAIKKAQANGHLAFVNTGRTIAEIEGEISEVGFDGYICGCGTYISYGSSVLLQRDIPSDTLKEVILDLHKYEIEAVLEGSSAVYYNELSTHPFIKKLYISQVDHNFTVKTWEDPTISVDKFCMWASTEEASDLFYNKYKGHFDFIDRNKRLYEVIPAGYSKATGIEFLLKHLNIPHENSYALGDSSNDLSMLNYVKFSIAMGNSEEEVRNMASFVTEDVDQDGIAYALKHYNMI